MDLPPCNSFCRLLTHKLADYYHMTHQVDPVAGAVRIFRTPFCRVPASLTSISNPPTTGNTPPPQMAAPMKIMRREGTETTTSPSKATSENGSDGKDKQSNAKDKFVVPCLMKGLQLSGLGYQEKNVKLRTIERESEFLAKTSNQAMLPLVCITTLTMGPQPC